MIITFFLNILNAFIGFMLGLLPTGNLPAAIESSFLTIWGTLNTFSYIFPIGTLLAAIGIIIAFDVAMIIWHIINWVIRKIPGMQ